MGMAETVTIDPRFNGPSRSGNGGYSCGVAALALGDGPAEVSLRLPPPLGVPLEVRPTETGIELADGDKVVASARPWGGSVEVAGPPSPETVRAAVAAFDRGAYAAAHPFPRCFTCGPSREDGDGIGFYPAPVAGDMVAWPWQPAEVHVGTDGLVETPIIWAAVDCPSGQAWLTSPEGVDGNPVVLGRLAARVRRRPAAGENLVLTGWRTGADGRKRHSASALHTEGGELLAEAAATWIVLDPEQAAAFKAGN